VTRWTLTGTHNGNLMGVPPTGKRVDCSAITIQRIAGGVIVEGWTIFDALGMMQQIGVVPSPGQAGG
jgi:predicted ester cyclase